MWNVSICHSSWVLPLHRHTTGSLTHSHLEILLKNAFWSWASGFLVTVMLLRAKTYHKPIYRSYTSQHSDPDAKYQLHRKQNFKIVFVFKSDTAVLTFTFCFLSSLFFAFLDSFFSFAGHLVGFISVGVYGRLRGEWVKICIFICWNIFCVCYG